MNENERNKKRKQRLKYLFAFNRKIGNSKEILTIISSRLGMADKLNLLSANQIQKILNELRRDHNDIYKRINKFRENVSDRSPISASEISSLVSIRLREWKIQYVDGRFESIGLQTDMRLSTIRRIVLHGVAEYDPF
ncbi:hypothetical protein Lepto782_15175 [Leptospira interrogans serovar Canicola]|uniref:Uncharacterized protein n=1 Tax=Leptospira interrogans serovar Canicola TaxID=211880 RepID=A0AAQ0AZL4_LEPIR|nr:hypothetical protein [Leptospira interrogans]KAA1293533.1 hypothetical protein C4X99_00065 [Leptospira interrogans serovar Geyaweera]QOI43463.1 hypothetical protein Lepto782_15175 [Leptospira interrogans serovar Canicola]ULG93577.1 hypothetical protein FH584_06725 [Leptospira interrogans]